MGDHATIVAPAIIIRSGGLLRGGNYPTLCVAAPATRTRPQQLQDFPVARAPSRVSCLGVAQPTRAYRLRGLYLRGLGSVYRSVRSLCPSVPSFGFSLARLWRLARFSAAFNLRDISRSCRIDDDCLWLPITVLPQRPATILSASVRVYTKGLYSAL